MTLAIPGQVNVGKTDYHSANGIAATPSIFRRIGVPILRGRGVDERDYRDAERVVVLSEFTALFLPARRASAVDSNIALRRQ